MNDINYNELVGKEILYVDDTYDLELPAIIAGCAPNIGLVIVGKRDNNLRYY